MALKLLKSERAAELDWDALDTEENELAQAEAQLSARLAELHQREGWLSGELESRRQSLSALVNTAAGALANNAMGRFQPLAAEARTVPEREKAYEARKRAVAARREALEAERKLAERRHASLEKAQEQLTELDQVLDKARSIVDEKARAAEQAERERAAREQARQAQLAKARAAEQAREQTNVPPESQPRADAGQEPERRRAPRVRLETEVDLGSDSNIYTGFSSDIAEGGVFVATSTALPPGTEVDLSFTLPGEHRVKARGVVRWARVFNDRTPDLFPGMGIQFTELSDESRSRIEAFVSEREPLFWPA